MTQKLFDFQKTKDLLALLKENAPGVHSAYVLKKRKQLNDRISSLRVEYSTYKKSGNKKMLKKVKDEGMRLKEEISIYEE